MRESRSSNPGRREALFVRRAAALAGVLLLAPATLAAQPAEGTIAAEATPTPTRKELAPWLGRYEAGREAIEVRWDTGPALHVGRIRVPIDGRWHETVATFSVRHRVTWKAERERIRFEEQHNEGARWLYEYALEGAELVKVVPAGAEGNDREVVRRRYRRVEPS